MDLECRVKRSLSVLHRQFFFAKSMEVICPCAVMRFVRFGDIHRVVSLLDKCLEWDVVSGLQFACPEFVTFVEKLRALHDIHCQSPKAFQVQERNAAMVVLVALFEMFRAINVMTKEIEVVSLLLDPLVQCLRLEGVCGNVIDKLLWCIHDFDVDGAAGYDPLEFVNIFCKWLINRLCATAFDVTDTVTFLTPHLSELLRLFLTKNSACMKWFSQPGVWKNIPDGSHFFIIDIMYTSLCDQYSGKLSPCMVNYFENL